MKQLNEKIAYLKGLAEGYGFSEQDQIQNVLIGIIEILQEMVSSMDGLQEAYDELNSYVEEIDEDLDLMEDVFYSELDDADDYRHCCHHDDEVDEEDDLFEVVCPSCQEMYLASYDEFDEDDVQCPYCGEDFKIEESVLKLLKETEE